FGITNAKAIVAEIPKELERKELNETLFTKAFQVASHFNYEICERFAPIFLRRTHVNSQFINTNKPTHSNDS
ncbi:hypothetical protein, partial [Leptospira noguchii]|uniref:hypothetical protein n=1 Tax=Leptospira noguchii TaxID=28182 RepID=UPI0007739E58